MLDQETFDNKPAVKKSRLNVLPANPEEDNPESVVGLGRFPSWLHRSLPKGGNLWKTSDTLTQNRLHTVCEEAKCPNLFECWSKKTATFLIMGKECTRACGFCDIDFSKTPKPLEVDEPQRVADSVKVLGLKHVVITMVARDDLPDQGAAHIAAVIKEVRQEVESSTIEVLTSDFNGNTNAIDAIIEAAPEIFNHNLETIRLLTPKVRNRATYDGTLSLLRYIKEHGQGKIRFIKSGMMLGLGESEEQVHEALRDLKNAGCDIVTLGQYLQPNRRKLPVKAFITPEQFKAYEEYGHEIGIKHMYCGPFVRSSYNADLVLEKMKDK